MYYTVYYFTGIFYAVVRQISMLFIDNKDSVFCLYSVSTTRFSLHFLVIWTLPFPVSTECKMGNAQGTVNCLTTECMVCIVVEWPVDHFAVQMFGINARWQQIHHQDRHIPHVGVVQPLWKPACHCCCIFCWGNHFFIILCSPLCLLKWQNCLNSDNIFSESQFTHGMYCFNRSGKGVLSGISSV